MKRFHNVLGLAVVITLSACSNFQYTPQERGVSFPLPPCTKTALQAARAELTVDKSLRFSPDWVCVTNPQSAEVEKSDEKAREELEAGARSEEELRTALETPFAKRNGTRPELGIALAGGGSKASAFGTGVLAGLADAGLLDSANYVSSVSGGSYAAYFYYSHRVFPLQRENRRRPTTRELFRDCVRVPEQGAAPEALREAIYREGGCETWTLLPKGWTEADGPPFNQYQAFLRCQQDMLRPGVCSTMTTTRDAGISGLSLLGSLTLFPFSNISNTLFDWGYGVSPSQRTYRNGIGVAFGSSVTDPRVLRGAEGGKRISVICAPEMKGYAIDCDSEGMFVTPNGKELTFQELRAGLLESRRPGAAPLPFWVINAAAPKYRTAFGWWTLGAEDSSNSDMFEMTAVSHGSGRYGYVSAPVSLHRMDVLDAVAASAAFFDANQLVYKQPWRGVIGVGLHIFNFDWGADIANYNVSDARRTFHKAMPIPLYWLDGITSVLASGSLAGEDRTRSAFIRLVDGGNGENLGVYSLVKRGVETIIVADAANDTDGQFQDVCALAARYKRAPEGSPKFLYIPGLLDLEGHCNKVLAGDDSFYDLHRWRFSTPVLMGCMRVEWKPQGSEQCSGLGPKDSHLMLVKPAIETERFWRAQTAPPMSKVEDAVRPKSYRNLRSCFLGTAPEMKPSQINCDTATFLILNWNEARGRCQTFPQHPTVLMTLDSSYNLFAAYRELGRQYIGQVAPLIQNLTAGADNGAAADFESLARTQAAEGLLPTSQTCAPGEDLRWARVHANP